MRRRFRFLIGPHATTSASAEPYCCSTLLPCSFAAETHRSPQRRATHPDSTWNRGWPKVRCDTRSAASERGVSSYCSMTAWGMFWKASIPCGCCALNRDACQGWAGHHQPRRRVPSHRVVGLSGKASKAVGENTPRCLVNFKTYKNLNKTPLSQNSSIDKSRATQVTSEFRPIPCPSQI